MTDVQRLLIKTLEKGKTVSTGIQHAKATILLSIPMGFLALGVGAGADGALACFGGALAGVLISPDLDIQGRTHSNEVVYQYMGSILGAAWYAFWWPYAWLIPHRNPLSHWPLVGTTGRVLYLSIVANLFWAGVILLTTGKLQPIIITDPRDSFLLAWVIIGLAAADTLHYGMDIITSHVARPFRNWRWKK